MRPWFAGSCSGSPRTKSGDCTQCLFSFSAVEERALQLRQRRCRQLRQLLAARGCHREGVAPQLARRGQGVRKLDVYRVGGDEKRRLWPLRPVATESQRLPTHTLAAEREGEHEPVAFLGAALWIKLDLQLRDAAPRAHVGEYRVLARAAPLAALALLAQPGARAVVRVRRLNHFGRNVGAGRSRLGGGGVGAVGSQVYTHGAQQGQQHRQQLVSALKSEDGEERERVGEPRQQRAHEGARETRLLVHECGARFRRRCIEEQPRRAVEERLRDGHERRVGRLVRVLAERRARDGLLQRRCQQPQRDRARHMQRDSSVWLGRAVIDAVVAVTY
eukprot:4180171-Pleurochrysis_carterae.AAC.1